MKYLFLIIGAFSFLSCGPTMNIDGGSQVSAPRMSVSGDAFSNPNSVVKPTAENDLEAFRASGRAKAYGNAGAEPTPENDIDAFHASGRAKAYGNEAREAGFE